MKSMGAGLLPRWLNVIMNFPESYDTGQGQLEVSGERRSQTQLVRLPSTQHL